MTLKASKDLIASVVLAIIAFVIVSLFLGALFGIGAAFVGFMFGAEVYAHLEAKFGTAFKAKFGKKP